MLSFYVSPFNAVQARQVFSTSGNIASVSALRLPQVVFCSDGSLPPLGLLDTLLDRRWVLPLFLSCEDNKQSNKVRLTKYLEIF